jgi:hypothetical protein
MPAVVKMVFVGSPRNSHILRSFGAPSPFTIPSIRSYVRPLVRGGLPLVFIDTVSVVPRMWAVVVPRMWAVRGLRNDPGYALPTPESLSLLILFLLTATFVCVTKVPSREPDRLGFRAPRRLVWFVVGFRYSRSANPA